MNIKSLLLGAAAALCFVSFASATPIDTRIAPSTHVASIEGVVTAPQLAVDTQPKIDKVAIKEIITSDDPFEAASVLPLGGLIIKPTYPDGDGDKLALKPNLLAPNFEGTGRI